MSRLMSRAAILTASRLSNFGVLALSPLLLVRILDVEGYGQYQEFMVFAMLLITLCEFGVDSSLTYFVPKYPERAGIFLKQTSFIIFALSIVLLLVLFLARPFFLEVTSYDFMLPLAVYVFCFANFNWLEFYWLATRRTDLVLYYSMARLLARVGTLLTVAWLTRDVETVIWAGAAVEAVRLVVVAVVSMRLGLLSGRLTSSSVKEQLRFSTPVGTAALVQHAGRNIGKLFISGALGPAALAYYAVGSYLMPLVRVVRGAISNVVFPELVRASQDQNVAIQLWQRTNVMFCVLLFPGFVIFAYYAEAVVGTLFTEAYLPAVPVFQVYLLWFLRRCFNFDVLLRTTGRTGSILVGTVCALAVNVVLMVVLYRQIGLIGPAVAFVVSEVALELYYARRVMRSFDLGWADVVDWRGLWLVTVSCAAAFPVLLAVEQVPLPALARIAAGGAAYVAVAWSLAYWLGIGDIGRVAGFAFSTMRKGLRGVRRSAA